MSLSFNPVPTLTFGDEVIYGINIIERLNDIDTDEARELLFLAASVGQRTRLPQLGFRMEDSRAVMPTKLIRDVGFDLTVIDVRKQLTPMTTMYESYISVDIPLGYYVELVPRSSLSKTGYMLANSVGIIDPGFIGTIKVPLIKIDASMPDLELPARVCQLLLKQYVICESYDASNDESIQTSRGDGGFGSTG